MTDDYDQSNDSNLAAHYVTETFNYPREKNKNESVSVEVCRAVTIRGGNLISDERDATGIMIWPASHLLCWYVASHKLGDCILELGCGCGVVGLVACKSFPYQLYVATDRDNAVLEMCRQNYKINGISAEDENTTSSVWVKSLEWGDHSEIQRIRNMLKANCGKTNFDAVVAADIVYPATCGEILTLLFNTVDEILKPGGIFWLAFVSRDGPRTPLKLIQTASEVGFTPTALPPLDEATKKKLPHLLDSKILAFRRHSNAVTLNLRIGGIDCEIFPGARAAMDRIENQSSDEEWDPPFANSGIDTELRDI